MVEALVSQSDFVGIQGVVYLYTGAEGALLRASADALQEYTQQKSRAEVGRECHAAVTLQCKTALARLLNTNAESIALVCSASEAINAVCGLIDFRSRDNIVVNDLEYPSVVLPCLRMRKRGVEVRLVRHHEWEIQTDALLAAVDRRTRLVALSHVSYVSGLRHDVEAIGKALNGTGTLFLIDATQSLGVLPVPTACADFVVSSSYKWLLGTHGLGVLYWNRSRLRDVEPSCIGRHSVVDAFGPDRYEQYALRPDAGRFETGYANFPAIYALSRSVPYLMDVGIERISRHVSVLGQMLIDGLSRLPAKVITPESAQRRGASISFLYPRAVQLGRALAERGTYVWAHDGRVRASIHLFNDEEDIVRYLAGLSEILDSV